MARLQYTSSRRMVMQAVMCLVLGGSVALAQWVVHQRRGSGGGGTALGAVREMGPIGVRLPVGWKLLNQSSAQVESQESETGDISGRVLVISQQRKYFAMSPARYFQMKNIHSEPIQIGPFDGVLAVAKERGTDQLVGDDESMHYVLLAQCLSPKGLSIDIELDCPALPNEDDKQLIREIAKAIVVPAKLR